MDSHAGVLVKFLYDDPSFLAYVQIDDKGRFHGQDLYRIVSILKGVQVFTLMPSYIDDAREPPIYNDMSLYDPKKIRSVTLINGSNKNSAYVTIDNDSIPDLRMEITFGITTWNQLIYRISDIFGYPISGLIDSNNKLRTQFDRTKIEKSDVGEKFRMPPSRRVVVDDSDSDEEILIRRSTMLPIDDSDSDEDGEVNSINTRRVNAVR